MYLRLSSIASPIMGVESPGSLFKAADQRQYMAGW